MKAHLKRLVAPRTWPLLRKSAVFVSRPHAGGHNQFFSLPLVLIVRDILGFALTSKEARAMVRAGQILVDGKPARDIRQSVGIMDIVQFPLVKKNFIISLSPKGKLILLPLSEKHAGVKICSVKKKSVIKGNKKQVHCHDGRTLLSDVAVSIRDSLLLKLPSQEVAEHLPFKEGATVLVLRGRHKGSLCEVKSIAQQEKTVTLLHGKEVFETAPSSLLVVDKKIVSEGDAT